MAIKTIKYGGAMCGQAEEKALISSIKKSIKSGNWQAGEQARLMEEEACKQLKVKCGVLTNSGSSAGLLALSSLELPQGSEVIISACTFPTIFNIILQCGLVPVVVDAKVGTYNFDINEVEQAISKKTKAIIAVHMVGNPVDMEGLMKVAKRHKVKIIEDCCDNWGGSIHGKMLGSFGDISFTSFHAAHIVSMGVGGAVFTNDKGLAVNVRQYRDWGRQANVDKPNTYTNLPADYNPRFIYDKIGYNFQILDLQAAMGRVQLGKAKMIKDKRARNFNYFYEHLSKYKELILPKSVEGADVCWHAFPLTTLGRRDKLVKYLEANGIETRSMLAGNITRQPAYGGIKYRLGSNLEQADTILEQSFWIGVHPSMTKSDLNYVAKVFDRYYATKK